jgi:hypothetical protein
MMGEYGIKNIYFTAEANRALHYLMDHLNLGVSKVVQQAVLEYYKNIKEKES